MFIELTMENGKKFIANVSRIDRVVDDIEKRGAYISGLTNNGGFYVKETYKEVLEKIIELKSFNSQIHIVKG